MYICTMYKVRCKQQVEPEPVCQMLSERSLIKSTRRFRTKYQVNNSLDQ